jgi:hypothetical protein
MQRRVPMMVRTAMLTDHANMKRTPLQNAAQASRTARTLAGTGRGARSSLIDCHVLVETGGEESRSAAWISELEPKVTTLQDAHTIVPG